MQTQKHILRSISTTVLTTVGILLIPLVAMQFSDEILWTSADFIVAGILLFCFGLVYQFVLQKVSSDKKRFAARLILVGLFLLCWAELAVGIFGTPFAGS